MSTDGREYDHSRKNSRGDVRKATDYDKVWDALDKTGIVMLGDHEFTGQTYVLNDRNSVKVGTVTFDNKNNFAGGLYYGEHFTPGRVTSQRVAINNLVARIEDMHGNA